MQIRYSGTITEPITLEEAKAYLKIDGSTDDAIITALIMGCRERIEEFTQRALVIKTIEAFYESEEVVDAVRVITLPYPSHATIDEVKINGVISTDYTQTGLNRFIVTLPSVVTSITTGTITDEGVIIKYTTIANCPEAIKTEIKRLILQQYEKRGNTFEGAIVELDENAYSNLMQFTV
jgi:uncharacterized phiE125 gp8 family phage protein